MKQHSHRIVFVTGKRGVGKSLVAAATALQMAHAGHNVLLVEFGSRSFYGSLFDLPVDRATAGETVPWLPGICIARWDVESALREYLTHYLVFKAATDRILGNRAMKALVTIAPSLSELTMLGKLTAPMRHRWYEREADVVVVEATPPDSSWPCCAPRAVWRQPPARGRSTTRQKQSPTCCATRRSANIAW